MEGGRWEFTLGGSAVTPEPHDYVMQGTIKGVGFLIRSQDNVINSLLIQ